MSTKDSSQQQQQQQQQQLPEPRWDQRSRFILGDAGAEVLARSCVAVIGIGGVGAYVVEALSRAGVGRLFLVDGDVLVTTNLNRHLLGTIAAVGRPKVELAAERVRSFNPAASVETRFEFVTTSHQRSFFPADVDFVVDACDIATVKSHIAALCVSSGTPVVLAMGAARRLDPTKVHVTTLDKTSGDPLAALLRKTLRKNPDIGEAGLSRIPVVMSAEPPVDVPDECKASQGRAILPSFCTVPAAAGLAIGHFVIRSLLDKAARSSTAVAPSSSTPPAPSGTPGAPPPPAKRKKESGAEMSLPDCA